MRAHAAVLLASFVLVLAGCGSGSATAPPPATVTVTAPASVPTVAPAATTAAPSADVAASWEMPDLVGENLQDAQNAIQALTDDAIFVTTSSDASGAGRNQIVDNNWKVCSQNIAPGTTITRDSNIDFAAVKLAEDC